MKEEAKEILGLLKNAFNIIATAFIALVAYLFVNFESLSKVKLIIAYIGIIFLTLCFIFILLSFAKYLKQLRE
ncbi:hypothetical protein CUPS4066_08505 [Campylobacter upsaliensis]|uniref:hypothetical protein n=1 Tax=Campylobacter upsaliensis TaxID=28080 RepID=UPI00214A15DE|nr:hypothetical protein [Campylobacter upsaliensis]MCR2099143.1 hypothetical protein [Campylobacter upsaliensis]MCR2103224.1 hypothetical protein [Campylobacter upsaliensis]MCR2108744.1 hypothetical protein [Campylobacter upsaliensis]MCR2112223.1 hypothetical protein [Campylobacter upsaliensis]MCR2123175.1 hypothetical protein [Campylobacter upsaliensis]